MTSLTERYVFAAMRTVPPRSRDDLAAELRASIADQIDARTDAGATPADAERDVLTELGDPEALAAEYTDRPLWLIGPRYFLTWWRLVKLLLWIVPPIVAAAYVLAKLLEDAPVGSIIGGTVGVAVTTGVHLVFWTTLVFALIDRAEASTASAATPVAPWSIDQLPEPRIAGAGRGDLIAHLVWLVVVVIAVIWDQFLGFVPDWNIPFLNPGLWPWWILGLFAVLAVDAVIAIAVYRQGRWRATTALVSTVTAAAIAVPALWLHSRGLFINPELVERLGSLGVDANAISVLGALVTVTIIVSASWGVLDAWIKTVRGALSPRT